MGSRPRPYRPLQIKIWGGGGAGSGGARAAAQLSEPRSGRQRVPRALCLPPPAIPRQPEPSPRPQQHRREHPQQQRHVRVERLHRQPHGGRDLSGRGHRRLQGLALRLGRRPWENLPQHHGTARPARSRALPGAWILREGLGWGRERSREYRKAVTGSLLWERREWQLLVFLCCPLNPTPLAAAPIPPATPLSATGRYIRGTGRGGARRPVRRPTSVSSRAGRARAAILTENCG
jgi:hypothetical protein